MARSGPEVDDVVLLRNDGVPAYNLAVVVDDAFSGIDQVVRGDDLLPAAATQAFLAELLGYPTPIYAHVPLALNAEANGWPSETVPSPSRSWLRRARSRALFLGLLRSRWTWHRLANASRPMQLGASILGYCHASHG